MAKKKDLFASMQKGVAASSSRFDKGDRAAELVSGLKKPAEPTPAAQPAAASASAPEAAPAPKKAAARAKAPNAPTPAATPAPKAYGPAKMVALNASVHPDLKRDVQGWLHAVRRQISDPVEANRLAVSHVVAAALLELGRMPEKDRHKLIMNVLKPTPGRPKKQ